MSVEHRVEPSLLLVAKCSMDLLVPLTTLVAALAVVDQNQEVDDSLVEHQVAVLLLKKT